MDVSNRPAQIGVDVSNTQLRSVDVSNIPPQIGVDVSNTHLRSVWMCQIPISDRCGCVKYPAQIGVDVSNTQRRSVWVRQIRDPLKITPLSSRGVMRGGRCLCHLALISGRRDERTCYCDPVLFVLVRLSYDG